MCKFVVVMAGMVATWAAAADPVREYLDPETGALVFDASGENTRFEIPAQPREFRDVEEYLRWVQERFHGRPIYNENGELIDVQGSYLMLGRPTYVFEGKTYSVREPVLQTIAGRFGFVVIGGERYEMPLDEEPPPFEEIEHVLFSQVNYRRSCDGGPLGPTDYCVQTAAFKHIYLFYQSLGGTLDIAGRAIIAPSTLVDLTLTFRDAFSRVLRFSSPITSSGVARARQFGVGGVGLAEWGIFGNPLIDPTKILSVSASAQGPQNNGSTGSAEAFWNQRYP